MSVYGLVTELIILILDTEEGVLGDQYLLFYFVFGLVS